MPVLRWLLGSMLGEGSSGSVSSPSATTATATTTATASEPVMMRTTAPLPTLGMPTTSTPEQQQQLHERGHTPVFSPRSLKQLGTFFGGAGFLMFTVMATRRAAVRHQIKAQLKFFQTNHGAATTGLPTGKREPLVAVEALNLATLNVMAFAIMGAGGISWAFDVSSVEDLRRMARRSIDAAGGIADEAAEKEVAEWVAKTLGINITQEPSSNVAKKA